MLNKRPIFVNGFQRGGTNILMQLITSHPQVRVLGGEMHEIFYGRGSQPIQKWLRRLTCTPVLVSTRQHTFWPYRYYERRALPTAVGHYIDLLFYFHKLIAYNPRYDNGRSHPTWADKSKTRMACKCVNGVVLATPLLEEVYPDATFVALVRNGLALCEGFMRRGWSAERFGRMYQTVCDQMLSDAPKIENYHIIRFEELMAEPIATVRQLYGMAGLDVQATEKFKLQSKKLMGRDGQRGYNFGNKEKELVYVTLDELGSYLRKDVNDNQIARLAEADKTAFLREAEAAMHAFGYLS
jgi:hypothetical protein